MPGFRVDPSLSLSPQTLWWLVILSLQPMTWETPGSQISLLYVLPFHFKFPLCSWQSLVCFLLILLSLYFPGVCSVLSHLPPFIFSHWAWCKLVLLGTRSCQPWGHPPSIESLRKDKSGIMASWLDTGAESTYICRGRNHQLQAQWYFCHVCA